MKKEFEERMKLLLRDKEDFFAFSEIIHKPARNFIRCNTLKISSEELVERLRRKW
jgi:16S rRNA C967 or C1407 C5-methylase (RsmB/RsmF family)